MGIKIGPRTPTYVGPLASSSKRPTHTSTGRPSSLGASMRDERSGFVTSEEETSSDSSGRAALKLLLESRGVEGNISKQLVKSLEKLQSSERPVASLLKNVLFSAVETGKATIDGQLANMVDLLVSAGVDGRLSGAAGLAALEYFSELLQRNRIRRKHQERLRQLINREPLEGSPLVSAGPDLVPAAGVSPDTVQVELSIETHSDVEKTKPVVKSRVALTQSSLTPIATGVDPQQWPSSIDSFHQVLGLSCREFTQALLASSIHSPSFTTAEKHVFRAQAKTFFLSYATEDGILLEDGVRQMQGDKALVETELGWGMGHSSRRSDAIGSHR